MVCTFYNCLNIVFTVAQYAISTAAVQYCFVFLTFFMFLSSLTMVADVKFGRGG